MHFVELAIVVGVGNAIESTRRFLFVVVHARVEVAIGEDHSVDRTNVDGNFRDVFLLELFARSGSWKTVEVAVLVARVDVAFVVWSQCHPGALRASWNRVEKLYIKSLEGFDAVNRCCFVLTNGRAHFFRSAFRLGLGLRLALHRSFRFGLRLGFSFAAWLWLDDFLGVVG